MKKAILFTLALTALAVPLAQAAGQLQVKTVVMFDAKITETLTNSVESGKTLTLTPTKSTEWVSSVSKGVLKKQSRALGLSGKLGPTLAKDGTVKVTSHLEYATVTDMTPLKIAGAEYPQPKFWSVVAGPTPKKGNIGQAIELYTSEHRGHTLKVVVTVTQY